MADAQEAIDAWMNNADKTPSPQKVKKETSKNTSGSKAFKRVDTEVWSKEIISGWRTTPTKKPSGMVGTELELVQSCSSPRKKFQHEKTKAKRSSS